MTAEAKDLIKKLLNPEPLQRPKLDEIENHPWFESIIPVKPQFQINMRSSMVSVSSSTAVSSARNSAVRDFSKRKMIKANKPIIDKRW